MTASAEPGRVVFVLWVGPAPDGVGIAVLGGPWNRDPTPADYARLADILIAEFHQLVADVGEG